MIDTLYPGLSDIAFIPHQDTGETAAGKLRRMSLTRSCRSMALAFLSLTGAIPFALGQANVPEVTSDTPAYCDTLRSRIAHMTQDQNAPPTEVGTLSAEGERMCVNGQVRGGIIRLRRAIAILRHAEE